MGNILNLGKWLKCELPNLNEIVRAQMIKLAEATGISIGSVVEILHEDLGMTKLTAKWVPRLLIINQKRQ